MAIRSEDLHLSVPNASPIFSKLAISTQFKVSLDLVRRSLSGDNLGLFEYLTNCGVFTETTSTSQKYDFLCSNASLPGSNFNISENETFLNLSSFFTQGQPLYMLLYASGIIFFTFFYTNIN